MAAGANISVGEKDGGVDRFSAACVTRYSVGSVLRAAIALGDKFCLLGKKRVWGWTNSPCNLRGRGGV